MTTDGIPPCPLRAFRRPYSRYSCTRLASSMYPWKMVSPNLYQVPVMSTTPYSKKRRIPRVLLEEVYGDIIG